MVDGSAAKGSEHTIADAPRLLALDSALDGSSVAVLAGEAVLAEQTRAEPRGQAESLVPMARDVLAQSGLGFHQLDAIAVTIGPGNFTGIRIALAAARGLALPLGRPVIGISTLEVLAAQIGAEAAAGRLRVAAIDARREEIYLQVFDQAMRPMIEPALRPLAALATVLPDGPAAVIGSGANLLAERFPGRDMRVLPIRQIDAVCLARRALLRDWRTLAPPPGPLYLRAPDAKLPGSGP